MGKSQGNAYKNASRSNDPNPPFSAGSDAASETAAKSLAELPTDSIFRAFDQLVTVHSHAMHWIRYPAPTRTVTVFVGNLNLHLALLLGGGKSK